MALLIDYTRGSGAGRGEWKWKWKWKWKWRWKWGEGGQKPRAFRPLALHTGHVSFDHPRDWIIKGFENKTLLTRPPFPLAPTLKDEKNTKGNKTALTTQDGGRGKEIEQVERAHSSLESESIFFSPSWHSKVALFMYMTGEAARR